MGGNWCCSKCHASFSTANTHVPPSCSPRTIKQRIKKMSNHQCDFSTFSSSSCGRASIAIEHINFAQKKRRRRRKKLPTRSSYRSGMNTAIHIVHTLINCCRFRWRNIVRSFDSIRVWNFLNYVRCLSAFFIRRGSTSASPATEHTTPAKAIFSWKRFLRESIVPTLIKFVVR